MQEQVVDKGRSPGPDSATVVEIVPMNMEVGLGSEDILWFERAVKDFSGREICQSILVPFYWNQRGTGILIPDMPSILYVNS